MTITKATTKTADGALVLHLEVDGHPAYVIEPKLTLLAQDIVVLLDDEGYWEGAVSADYHDPDGDDVTTLPAAVKDTTLAAIVRRFGASLQPEDFLN